MDLIAALVAIVIRAYHYYARVRVRARELRDTRRIRATARNLSRGKHIYDNSRACRLYAAFIALLKNSRIV